MCFVVFASVTHIFESESKETRTRVSQWNEQVLAESFQVEEKFHQTFWLQYTSNHASKLSPFSQSFASLVNHILIVYTSRCCLLELLIVLSDWTSDPRRPYKDSGPEKTLENLSLVRPFRTRMALRVYTQKEIWFCCRLTILNYPLSGGDETSVATHPFATPPWLTCFPIRGWTQREFMNGRYSGTNRG